MIPFNMLPPLTMIFIFIVIKVSSPISAYPLSEFDLFQGPIVVVVVVVVIVVIVVVIIIVIIVDNV